MRKKGFTLIRTRLRQNLVSVHAFTLIELLVVITIIGILMGLLLVAYQGTRKSARDVRRKADLEQIRSALEMCRSDKGSYPSSLGTSIVCGGGTYMASVPLDPLNPTFTYTYKPVTLDGGVTYVSYTLCSYLEGGFLASSCSDSCLGNCGSACNYKTCNP